METWREYKYAKKDNNKNIFFWLLLWKNVTCWCVACAPLVSKSNIMTKVKIKKWFFFLKFLFFFFTYFAFINMFTAYKAWILNVLFISFSIIGFMCVINEMPKITDSKPIVIMFLVIFHLPSSCGSSNGSFFFFFAADYYYFTFSFKVIWIICHFPKWPKRRFFNSHKFFFFSAVSEAILKFHCRMIINFDDEIIFYDAYNRLFFRLDN